MKNYKSFIFKVLKNGGIFAILIVFTFYFVFKDMNLKNVINTISNTNGFYLFIATLCMCIFLSSEAINFRRNLKILGYKTSFFKCINYSINGFFFSSITPSASGGQPMQLYQMYKDDVKISHSTLVLFIEFIFFQAVTIMYAIVGYFGQYKLLSNNIDSLKYLFIIGLLCNFSVLVVFLLVLFYSKGVLKIVDILAKFLRFCKLRNINKIEENIKSIINEYKECSSYIIKNKIIILKTFITKCIQIFAFHSIPYWIYRSFGFDEYSIFVFVGAQAVLYISVSALPLPGAVGASESGFFMIFRLLFSMSIINEAMLLSRGISFYLFVFLSGLFLLVKWIIDINENKKIERKKFRENLPEKIDVASVRKVGIDI